jgi:hypothetical protein
MSYTRTIRINGELEKRFKPSSPSNCYDSPSQFKINKEKRVLDAYCMRALKNDSESVWASSKIYENIEMQLKMIQYCVHDLWATNIQTSLNEETKWCKKGEIDFNGWEWSDCGHDSPFDSEQDVVDTYVDNIFRLVSCVDTPDYFKDKESWFEYYNDINDEVNGFEEMLIDFYNHDFVDFYHDCTVNPDEEESTNCCTEACCANDEPYCCDDADSENWEESCDDEDLSCTENEAINESRLLQKISNSAKNLCEKDVESFDVSNKDVNFAPSKVFKKRIEPTDGDSIPNNFF